MNMKSNFGPLAKTYTKARQGYPKNIYITLQPILAPDSQVLDVGCGTGISTRELQRYFKNITGLDIDVDMLIEARAHNDQINYIQGDIGSTNFESGVFDLITAFSAFHWFTTQEDVQEIYRILKPNGTFCTVNKTDTNKLRPIFKNVLGQFDVATETSVKTGAYNPKSLMEEGGFTNVSEKLFEYTEWYDIEGALLLMQSWNAWSYLNDAQKNIALTEIRGTYQDLCDQDGKIARTLEIKMVIGKK